MASLQEALADVGLAHSLPIGTPAHGSQPPDAPAATMGHARPTRRYTGRRPAHWGLDGYDENPIGATRVNKVPVKRPADVGRATPQEPTRFTFAEVVMTDRLRKRGIGPAAIVSLIQDKTCTSCRLMIPAGHKSCPDC